MKFPMPSAVDWQVIILFANGCTRLYHFPRIRPLSYVRHRANEEARDFFDRQRGHTPAAGYLILDNGEIVAKEPTTDSIGQPYDALGWEAALAGTGL